MGDNKTSNQKLHLTAAALSETKVQVSPTTAGELIRSAVEASMDGATDDETGRRIGMFCVGLALTGFFTFVGGGAFALANENFYADYWQGWAEARDRLAGSLGLAAVVGVSVTFAGLGIWCVGRAVVGSRPRRRT